MRKYVLIFLFTTSSLLAQYDLIIDRVETPQQAGVPFMLSVRFIDAQGNPAPISISCDLTLLTPAPRQDLLSPIVVQIVDGVGSTEIEVYYAATGLTIYGSIAGIWEDTSNVFTVQPDSFARFMGLLPGQSPDPGNLFFRGRAGTPSPATSGEGMDVVVYTTDLYWNHLTNLSGIPITVTSTDTFIDSIPGTINNGLDTLQIVPKVAGHHNLFVSDDTITDTSTVFEVVPGDYERLLILVPPYERIPGSDEGYDARLLPSPWDVAKEETVSVYATDKYWNNVVLTAYLKVREILAEPAEIDTTITIQQGFANIPLIFRFPGYKRLRVWHGDTVATSERFRVLGTGIDDLPPIFAYPNPMSDNTTINFRLSPEGEHGTVEIVIYDVFGYHVWEKRMPAGDLERWEDERHRYIIEWNGETQKGVKVANGIYAVRMINMVGGRTIDVLEMSIGVRR